MKNTLQLPLLLAMCIAGPVFAQAPMAVKDGKMERPGCQAMKGMATKDCAEKTGAPDASQRPTITHSAVATVKEVDAAKGKVILAHEAIQSLNWPPMTMGFTVIDKTLFGKLVVGKQVHVDIKKEGAEYVVIGVR
ncbi:copper-binding protein [Janthinobacterium sp. GB1R12]|uniref:copper-binding protein n=1 Tax=Janthinobacterium sp. GB1R12 TaxID=3424190 RepID=UPI003F28F6C1